MTNKTVETGLMHGDLAFEFTSASGIRACIVRLWSNGEQVVWVFLPKGHPLHGEQSYSLVRGPSGLGYLYEILPPKDGMLYRCFEYTKDGTWAMGIGGNGVLWQAEAAHTAAHRVIGRLEEMCPEWTKANTPTPVAEAWIGSLNAVDSMLFVMVDMAGRIYAGLPRDKLEGFVEQQVQKANLQGFQLDERAVRRMVNSYHAQLGVRQGRGGLT